MIATLTFTVRDPVSVNGAYARRKGGGGDRYMTAAGKAFKLRVGTAALIARPTQWPFMPLVSHARVSYQLYDYRGDVDGPAKLLRDALEGVLYVNDRIVEDGPHPLPIKDGAGKRIVVTVDVIAVMTQAEADARASAADRRKAARPSRVRRARQAKPRWI